MCAFADTLPETSMRNTSASQLWNARLSGTTRLLNSRTESGGDCGVCTLKIAAAVCSKKFSSSSISSSTSSSVSLAVDSPNTSPVVVAVSSSSPLTGGRNSSVEVAIYDVVVAVGDVVVETVASSATTRDSGVVVAVSSWLKVTICVPTATTRSETTRYFEVKRSFLEIPPILKL